jgi:hypothetical protein
MSLKEIEQICSLFEIMDIDDNKIVKHMYQNNLKYIIVLLRNSKVLLYICRVFKLNINEARIIREGFSNPLYEQKIEKIYNLFTSCSPTKQQTIYRIVMKLISKTKKRI